MTGIIQKQIETKVQKNSEKPNKTIREYIKLYENQIARALPSMITPERFVRMALTAVNKTPKLGECDPNSFIGAMLTSAQLGLEPNTPLGQAYLIPYGDSCQFQIGYKGLLELVHRSGEIKTIEARSVYENDEFTIEYGLNHNLVHKPCLKDKGDFVGVYAVYHTNNGGSAFEFMSKQEIENHRNQYSKAYRNKDSAWQTDFESMAKKTIIKRLLKYAPLKAEIARAISLDEKDKDIEFVDNEIVIINEEMKGTMEEIGVNEDK